MKTIFLVHVRSGSHLLSRLVTGSPTLSIDTTATTPLLLNTSVEPCTLYTRCCPTYEELLFGPDDNENKILVRYAHETRPDRAAPEDGGIWDLSNVRKIKDTKIIHLIRDGRNQLESWMRHLEAALLAAKKPLNPWDDHQFRQGCIRFKEKAYRAIECDENLDNFMLLRFEDLVDDPTSVVEKIYKFIGLTLIPGQVSKNYSLITANSSFNPSFDTRRWIGWSRERRQIFQEEAGKELLRLGYIKDNSWLDEQ